MSAQLTAREQELLVLGFKCAETSPKINFDKLAKLASLKNAATASVVYGNAKRKLLRAFEDSSKPGDGGNTPVAPATPAKPKGATTRGRKRKVAIEDSASVEDNEGGTEHPGEPEGKRVKVESDAEGSADITEEDKAVVAGKGKKVASKRAPRVKKEAIAAEEEITKTRATRATRAKKESSVGRAAKSKSKTPGATLSVPTSALTSPGHPPGSPVIDESIDAVSATPDTVNEEEVVQNAWVDAEGRFVVPGLEAFIPY